MQGLGGITLLLDLGSSQARSSSIRSFPVQLDPTWEISGSLQGVGGQGMHLSSSPGLVSLQIIWLVEKEKYPHCQREERITPALQLPYLASTSSTNQWTAFLPPWTAWPLNRLLQKLICHLVILGSYSVILLIFSETEKAADEQDHGLSGKEACIFCAIPLHFCAVPCTT